MLFSPVEGSRARGRTCRKTVYNINETYSRDVKRYSILKHKTEHYELQNNHDWPLTTTVIRGREGRREGGRKGKRKDGMFLIPHFHSLPFFSITLHFQQVFYTPLSPSLSLTPMHPTAIRRSRGILSSSGLETR